MQVFISWSGERSKNIAQALNWFLPRVINTIDPWMSAEGIDPGVRWNADIASHLETTNFGIICLTSNNLDAPWIHFEAGAISKFIDKSFVVPYLLDIKPIDIVGPLTQFQSKIANKTDTRKIIEKIYELSISNDEFRIPMDVIKDTYEKYWVDFKKKIEGVPKQELPESQKRQPDEMFAEILELLRSLNLKQSPSRGKEISVKERPQDILSLINKLNNLFHVYFSTDKIFGIASPREFIIRNFNLTEKDLDPQNNLYISMDLQGRIIEDYIGYLEEFTKKDKFN